MLAMSCPRCGAPIPLSLGDREEVRCRACDHRGPPPEDVARGLGAAASVVERHAATERQLHGLARVAVTRGASLLWAYGALVLLLASPLALMALVHLVGLVRSVGTGVLASLMQLSGAVVVLLVLVLGSLPAMGGLHLLRRRVERAAAAVPPAREGEPARCHVCGGDLLAEGVRGVARCGYCEADNVVSPQVLERVSTSRVEALEDHAAAVEARGRTLGRAGGCAMVSTMGLAAAAPFGCGIPAAFVVAGGGLAVMLVQILWFLSGPPTEGNRYAWVRHEGARCVAWYNPYLGAWQVEGQLGKGVDVNVTGSGFAVKALAGKRLRSRSDPEIVGVVRKARWGYWMDERGVTLDGPDRLDLDVAGRTRSATTWSLCEDPG